MLVDGFRAYSFQKRMRTPGTAVWRTRSEGAHSSRVRSIAGWQLGVHVVPQGDARGECRRRGATGRLPCALVVPRGLGEGTQTGRSMSVAIELDVAGNVVGKS